MKLSTSLITITMLFYGMVHASEGPRERHISARERSEELALEEAIRTFEALPPANQQQLIAHCRQIWQTGRCEKCVQIYLAREREKEMQESCPIGVKVCLAAGAFFGVVTLASLYQAPIPQG